MMLNLNLGSGSKRIEGFVNLDKFDTFNPDIVHDLEIFPYPFKDSSVDKIILSHVMEHIGQTPDMFNSIIRELYRICKNQAIMDITVPHPRHDDFLADPTHVRPITVLGLSLYDKEKNRQWEKENKANSPLGLIHNVNFKIINVRYDLTRDYVKMVKEKKITQEKLFEMIERYNNIVKQIFIQLKVIK